MHIADEELMRRYMDGEAHAFNQLYDRYAGPLFGFFFRSFRDRAAAEDLVQATFLKLHDARASFDLTAPVKPWLYSIAARARIDALRKKYRALGRTLDDEQILDRVESPSQAPDAAASSNEEVANVQVALDSLSEGSRMVILLHRFEGFSFKEISEMLGIEEGAARVRAFRAYAAFRTAYEHLDAGKDSQ